MAAVGYFGCLKFTLDHIFTKWLPAAILDVRSICNFFLEIFDKMAAILDVRNSLSIAFLAISDRLAILDFRNSLSIAILSISDRYRIFFCGHCGCPKITLDCISGHFR